MQAATLSLPAATEYLNFSNRLADAAAAVTLPLFRKSLPIEVKSDASPFTVADCDAEKAMCDLIRTHYPQHGIIGEEHGSHNTGAEFIWVMDPIDGTRSFISGNRQYATMVTLLYQGIPAISVIDFPALQERYNGMSVNDCRQAHFNDKPCRVSSQAPTLQQAVAATTTVAVVPNSSEDKQLQQFLPACGHVRLGGDCYAYSGVAAGFSHIAIDYLMQPYDYLPLIPLIHGAGGIITDWTGKPLTPFNAEDGGSKTVLASANDILHQQALAALAAP